MKINKQHGLIIVAAAVAILILATALAYTTKISFLQQIYPAAVVNGQIISLDTWQQAQTVASKFEPSYNAAAVFERLINTEQKRQLVLNLHLNQPVVSFADEIKFLQTGRTADYNQLVSQYFGRRADLLEKLVVAPRVYDATLRIKYNSDYSIGDNAVSFERAKAALAEIQSGKDFSVVAKQTSDDKVTSQLGGDLGFVELPQLLPEVAEAISKLALGQASSQIVVSRLGYHIFYPVETAQKDGQTVYHIKQILITTNGYDNWLNPQLNGFSVWRIIKP